jgi:large subunit ribosomal protein L25
MSNIVIDAESRVRSSTSAVRRMRREGLVPGIVYGGENENVNIKMDHNNIVHSLEEEAFHSSILDLNIDGKAEKVILRAYDVHPASDVKIMHVDFQRVSRKDKLSMTVPLHFTGEEECEGITMDGGIISRIMNDLDIVCLPADLPEYISVDISSLRMGESITLGEVVLPEGVESQILNADGDAEQMVVHIAAPQVEVEPEEEEVVAADDVPAERESDSEEDGEGKED